jgi:peptidoglycan/LPS O-acetylase OafA/YrhL
VDSHAAPRSDRDNPGGFAHIPALDGIRGLAILLVLFDHLFWANSQTGSRVLDFISALREASYIGVNLFFALSGFLITGILMDSLNTPHFFSNFYARRSLRIFPLYYGFLLLVLLLTPVLHLTWSGWEYSYLTYTSNLIAPFHGGPLKLGVFNINHFWSLQVEEQFYWIWPLVVYRFRNSRSIVRMSLAGCGVALGLRIACVLMKGHAGFGDPYLPYSFTPCCADNLLYGCCLAALVRSARRDRVLRAAPYVFLGCAAILCVVSSLNNGLDWTRPDRGWMVSTGGFSLMGIASASMIAWVLKPGSSTKGIFETRFLRFMGKYSYGIYVFHYSIGSVMAPLRSFFDAHLHVKALGVLFGALIAGAASVGAAWVSYRFYEAPFLRLKRYFSYQRAG